MKRLKERFAKHCTAPYEDIICLKEAKIMFTQHCTARHTDIIWINKVCPNIAQHPMKILYGLITLPNMAQLPYRYYMG